MAQRKNDRRGRSDAGAALVEFAIILPLVVLLFFGIIESSWAFYQANDVRHGAREGARLAAVDWGDVNAIGNEVCDRMDFGGSTVTVTLSAATSPAEAGNRGSEGRIAVQVTYQSITGFLDAWLGGKQITSDVDFNLEQPTTGEASWWNTGLGGSVTCS
ncbi:MAG: pilus assembly protein [Armatimonadetes bacterium]|nr:MAG: pilus assembly protein [Armatimonadota bacterium]